LKTKKNITEENPE